MIESKSPRRRGLLKNAAMAAGAMSAPMIATAQTTTTLRFQSTWPSKDIFREYANDFAKKVNDMAGGRLKIEVLPAGAVVPAFQLLDAVNRGTLDGGHGVVACHNGKNSALALWGSAPSYGMDPNMLLSWHNYGGGKAILDEIYKSLNMDVVSYLYGSMPTQPLSWFKKPASKVEDMKGLKFRTVGLAVDVFTEMGAAVNPLPGGEIVQALDRGLINAVEINNASSDRLLGFPDVAKNCMLQSFHQSGEQFEILFNKTKYNALPQELRSIIDYAVQAASADMSWKAISRNSRNSQDYIELKKAGVKLYKTPDAILRDQLAAWVKTIEKEPRKIRFSKRCWTRKTVCPARRPVAQRLHRGLQDGLQPLLWHGQEGLTAGRRFQGALDSTLFLLSGPLPAAQGGSHAIVFTRGGSRFSTLIGKTCAWSVVALMLLISWEVFNRYALNRPHAWVLDAQIMLYGLLLMMAGAYTLSKNGHVRGDVLYGFLRPRTQTIIDLALYIVFFLPGVVALTWAGWTYANESLAMREQTFNPDPIPLYPFKFVIPFACTVLLMQGVVEIIRCIICIQTAVWPAREGGVEEVDVEKLREMVHVKDEDSAALERDLALKESDK